MAHFPTPQSPTRHEGVTADATFAIVPTWVLDGRVPDARRPGHLRHVSDRAVRLYAVLRRYADLPHGAVPSRARLAERLGCSRDSVDRAVDDLVALGAVRVEHRVDDEGDATSNRYHLTSVPGGTDAGGGGVAAPVRPPVGTGAATGGRTGAARSESDVEEDPPTPPHAGGRCSRHPSGPVTGRPCRGCGTDRASLAAAQRRATAAAASAAAALRAATRTGIGAERDSAAATVGAPAVRAAREAARRR